MKKINKIKYLIFAIILFSLIIPALSLAQGGLSPTLGTGSSGGTGSFAPISGSSGTGAFTPLSVKPSTNVTLNSSRPTACNQLDNNGGRPKLGDLFNYITCLIAKSVIPLIFSLAIAMFLWGVVMYVINSNEEAKKAKGKMFMIWGIIALTVMVSVWGLVAILGNTFKIDTGFIPQVKGGNSSTTTTPVMGPPEIPAGYQ